MYSLYIIEKILTKKPKRIEQNAILMTRTEVKRLPINLESITTEEMQITDDVIENTKEDPTDRSVYDNNGLSNIISAPLQT